MGMAAALHDAHDTDAGPMEGVSEISTRRPRPFWKSSPVARRYLAARSSMDRAHTGTARRANGRVWMANVL